MAIATATAVTVQKDPKEIESAIKTNAIIGDRIAVISKGGNSVILVFYPSS